MGLSTDWEIIGQSGPTTDGRTIEPQMLIDAAETYNPKQFTALIWPLHAVPKPYWLNNFGKVLALKLQRGANGTINLLAKLSPNELYLAERTAGQKMFTSMELQPNFAGTGRWYLTGVAAVDDPASLGTTEVQFGKKPDAQLLFSSFIETQKTTFDDQQQSSIFDQIKALFKNQSNEDADMADKKALDELKAELGEIKALFSKLAGGSTADDKQDDKDKTADPTKEAFATLNARLDALEAKFSHGGDDNDKGDEGKTNDALSKLEAKFTAMEGKLEAALKEQPGTQGGEHFGAEEDAGTYL